MGHRTLERTMLLYGTTRRALRAPREANGSQQSPTSRRVRNTCDELGPSNAAPRPTLVHLFKQRPASELDRLMPRIKDRHKWAPYRQQSCTARRRETRSVSIMSSAAIHGYSFTQLSGRRGHSRKCWNYVMLGSSRGGGCERSNCVVHIQIEYMTDYATLSSSRLYFLVLDHCSLDLRAHAW